MARSRWKCAFFLVVVCLSSALRLEAATRSVAAGGDLQAALNAAQPGDTVLLAEGAEFVGNFILPAKSGDQWITLRTSAPDSVLPPAGWRIKPSDAGLLARLRSPNGDAALRTAAGAHHWNVRYLEFPANDQGNGDVIQIGDGGSTQNSLASVPHHITLEHLYVHGDPKWGQKRGIALNAASVTVRDSYVGDCKGVGQDTQAIGGWNGPGPYTIENNYLEAAGENVMFGGSDPSIPNLVASGITFRSNYVSRPMSWKDPILRLPGSVTTLREDGGSLPDGVYAYRVVAQGLARGNLTPTIATRSTASVESTVTTTGGASAVRVRWQAVPGATEYRVYGRTAGAESVYWTVSGTEFVDTGAAGVSAAVPTTAGTVWNVKNMFELKSARNVVVENNIFENHWKEGQPGFAVVLTPRNSNGGCPWCVVEHVRFEYNLFVNIAAAVNVLGYDDARPTQQTNDLAFRNNVVTRMNTSLGGPARFMQLGAGPRDIVLEHNTIDANGSGVVYVYGGTSTDPLEVNGFVMRANAARHGSYGIHGAFFAYGNDIIAHYFPAGVFDANYLAGASAAKYPAATIVVTPFESQFADVAAGDFTVRDGSPLKHGAADGSDVGANYPELSDRVKDVRTGRSALLNLPPNAGFRPACVDLKCTFTDTSTDDGQIAARSWSFGSAGVSTATNPTFVFAAPGTYTVSLTVTDNGGLQDKATQSVTVTATVHAALLSAPTKKWTSASGATTYWSADVVVAAHGAGEGAVAGATITVAWTGAVVKTATCVTGATGQCTLPSGTLSYLRSTVTVTVTGVSAPSCSYNAAANHTASGPGSVITAVRP
jgi:PKD repeat protein